MGFGSTPEIVKIWYNSNMETRITGLTELFSKSIGIEEPWYIRSIETVKDEVHIYVDVRDEVRFPCPDCGELCKRAGYEKKERVWRHGDCVFYPCYVHCRRPRVECDKHGTKVVDAPWARKSSRFTLLFEGYAMLILADMPISKAAKLLRCNEKSLVKIMRYWVKKAVDETVLSDVTSIAVDETSFKRGQSYVTIVYDAERRRVIDVENGRKTQTIIDFSYKLESKNGDCGRIRYASSDMSQAYTSGINFCFPNAKHVIDKFHVKKEMLDAMDEVRRSEQRETKHKSNAVNRKLLMIPEARQTVAQSKKIAELSKQFPKTGRAYRMVQAIDILYASRTIEDAQANFKKLYQWMRRGRLEPMKRAAETLKKYKDEILNYFRSHITNAICEGFNSMIQAAKRKARGYHTFEGYASMIYLIAGKLRLACPNPLR